MKWYNRHIFRHLGQRRLFTRDEFTEQMQQEVGRSLRVITRREHELLLDIAAIARLISRSRRVIRPDDSAPMLFAADTELSRRLELALASYAIAQDDRLANTPPSANRTHELHLLEMP